MGVRSETRLYALLTSSNFIPPSRYVSDNTIYVQTSVR